MFLADSMGFIDLPGNKPFADENFINKNYDPRLNLLHLTSVPPWLTKTEDVLKAHKEFVKVLERQKIFKIIRTKDDLIPFTDRMIRYTIAVILGLQNTPDDVLENDNLKKLFDAGIRIMAIAYEDKNVFGGGCMAPKEFLTEEGGDLLRALAKNKIIFDISHSGLRTAWHIARYRNHSFPELAIFASHSGCYNLYFHNRNITDDVLLDIVRCRGIIGIPTLTFILDKEDNTLNPFMRHIKHAVNIAGEDNVCVGSDGVYKYLLTQKLKDHHDFMLTKIKNKEEWKIRFPEHPMEIYSCYKMKILADKLRNFYSEKVVEKICGLNFFNFLFNNLPSE